MSAREIHDLVRGVAPPYPGAFASVGGVPLRILRTLRRARARRRAGARRPYTAKGRAATSTAPRGGRLRLLEFELDGRAAGAAELQARFGPQPVTFD